jgi:hypothetical protein
MSPDPSFLVSSCDSEDWPERIASIISLPASLHTTNRTTDDYSVRADYVMRVWLSISTAVDRLSRIFQPGGDTSYETVYVVSFTSDRQTKIWEISEPGIHESSASVIGLASSPELLRIRT